MNNKRIIGILGAMAMTTTIVAPSIPQVNEQSNHKENTIQTTNDKNIKEQTEGKDKDIKTQTISKDTDSSKGKLELNNNNNNNKLQNETNNSKNIEKKDYSIKENSTVKSQEKETKTKEQKPIKLNTVAKNPVNQVSINIDNVWYQPMGVLSFDTNTKKFKFSGSWAQTNPYASKNELLFKISLVNESGLISKSLSMYGSDLHPDNILNELNNWNFEYGDKLVITYKASSQISIKGLVENGKINTKPYYINKKVAFNIDKTGISIFNNQKTMVDPLPIEGASNLVTACTVKGRTVPEAEVSVLVGGKTFTTKSNYVGTFSVPVTGEEGIKSTTPITVCVAGQFPVIVYPTAIPNLGINKASISTNYNCGLTNETLNFNTKDLQVNISESGTNQFSSNLIENGVPIAKSETTYFSGFSGKNNLKNSDFKYGDILSVYQTSKAQILWNEPTINTGKNRTSLGSDKFAYYEITVNGLVPVTNKDLTVNQPYYDGASSIDITGETKANINVKVSVGSYSTTVRSSSTGAYKASIPETDINVGDVISVYVDNSNFKQIIYNYSPNYALGTSKIQVSNYYGQPIFYVGFNLEDLKLTAAKNITYYNYGGGQETGSTVGTFYTNKLKFKLINPITGDVVYDINTDKLNDGNSFVNGINGKTYRVGDILEISYSPNLLNIEATNSKTNLGNSTSSNEYFEITNKGLVNVSDKFIDMNPVEVLGSGVNSTDITGIVKANSKVTIKVNGKTFEGQSNSNGNFSIPVTVAEGFTPNTDITVSSNGYIPTKVKLEYKGKVTIQNSYINFYNESSASSVQSSIGFDPANMKFIVQNYVKSFGKGNINYFTLGLYKANGETIIEPTEIKDGPSAAVAGLLNGKSFEYGDVISLSYNPQVSIPVALNNQSVIANINGKTEYFEITKNGLVRVNFGEKIYTKSVAWNGDNLLLGLEPSIGNNLTLENGTVEIVGASNKVVETSSISNGKVEFTSSQLKNLTNQNDYTIAIKLGDKTIPVYVNSNIFSNKTYKLFTNTNDELAIKLNHVNYNISSGNDITSYSKKTDGVVKSAITNIQTMNSALTNAKQMNNVITNAFINRFGVSNLQDFYKKSNNNVNFINWVLNNDVAMSEYLEATNIGKANVNSLQIWSDIWKEYTNSHSGFNLKLAIATALANETTIYDCFNGKAVGSPVVRYNIFENLNDQGGMVKGFDTLNVKLLESVVDVPVTNPQIEEMRSLLLQNHNNIVRTNDLPVTDYSINYTFRNPYNGASIFGSWEKFYGKNSTVADVFKIGGVCGSISRLGSIACRVFGQPAHQMGEPGHDAFYSYDLQNGKWYSQYGETTVAMATGFDVSGWSKGLALNGYIVTYNALYTAANNKNLIKSNQYLWMANSSLSYSLKLEAINNALKAQPLNVEAWLAKINLLKSNKNATAQDYINLSNDLISALKDYPEPMFDLLVKFNKNLLQIATSEEYNNFVAKVTNILDGIVKKGDSSQKTQANRILKDGYMKDYGFTLNQPKLLGRFNINSWKRSSPTVTIEFDENNEIKATGIHTWIATTGNTGIKMNFFNANMNKQRSLSIAGNEFGTTMINSFDKATFTNGEIIEVTYTPGEGDNGSLSMEGVDLTTKNIPNIITLQVTQEGLKVLNGEYTAPNGKKYNLDTGFKTTSLGTKYYIFGQPQVGLQIINNKTYYFNNEGIMQTGLQTIGNNGYYFNKDGIMQTGWQTLDNNKYYFGSNGQAIPGYQTVDGKKYLFANNGLEVQNIIPNSDMKVSSYSTEQNNTTYSANNIIDGNLNNNWQNIWNQSDKNPYITIELNHAYNVKTLICFPRQDGGWNGDIQKYKILVSMNGKDFTTITDGEWIYSNAKESQFENLNDVEAKYIKIESEEGIDSLATISEVILSGTEIANKTGLEQEITKGKALEKNAKYYTGASVQVLTNALANGQIIINNTKATQKEIYDAQNTIINAIKGLEVNKQTLLEELNKAKGDLRNEKFYTKNSIENLSSLVTSAEKVMANKDATITEVNTAVNNLINGIKDLKINKLKLAQDIKNAKQVLATAKGYTQESINELSHAILNGANIVKENNATIAEVNNAEINIKNAINGLNVNKLELQNEVNKVNEVLKNSNEYTPSSVKLLKSFESAAQNVLNNQNATPAQVKTAITSLESGIIGLVANKTNLINEINVAKTKLTNKAEYSSESIDALSNEVNQATKVNKNKKATVSEVENVIKALESVINELKPNEKGLEKVISEGKTVLGNVKGDTQNSITTLSKAIINGQKVLANPNATSEEISDVAKKIETAIKGLRANKTDLQNTINKANILLKDKTQYTENTVKALSNDVKVGEVIMNNQNATPAQVKEAVESILNGVTGLENNHNKSVDTKPSNKDMSGNSIVKPDDNITITPSIQNKKVNNTSEINKENTAVSSKTNAQLVNSKKVVTKTSGDVNSDTVKAESTHSYNNLSSKATNDSSDITKNTKKDSGATNEEKEGAKDKLNKGEVHLNKTTQLTNDTSSNISKTNSNEPTKIEKKIPYGIISIIIAIILAGIFYFGFKRRKDD